MVIFDTAYSSYVYQLATADSDHDSRYVFWEPGVFRTRRDEQSRWGYSLDLFLQLCLLGQPDALDLLFLPDSAYTVPLPDALKSNRSKFVTLTAWQQYLARAEDCRRRTVTANGNYLRKKAGHAYIYLHSADMMASNGAPDFGLDVGNVRDVVQQIRTTMTADQFNAAYDELRQRVMATTPNLPRSASYHLTDQITAAITGVTVPALPLAVAQAVSLARYDTPVRVETTGKKCGSCARANKNDAAK